MRRVIVVNQAVIVFPSQVKVANVLYDLRRIQKGSNPRGEYTAAPKRLPKGARRFIKLNIWEAQNVAFPGKAA